MKNFLHLPWNRTAAAFDAWAPSYEKQVDQMIRARGYSYAAMAQRVVTELSVGAGEELLEIGTGPGNLGSQVAAVAAEPRLRGLDISGRMLSLARAKNVYQSVARAGADRLPYASEAFDGVYSAFVLHSVLHQERAFRELWRVLRPGRRAVLIDLSPSRGSVARALVTGFFHSLRREFGAPALYWPVEHYVRFALEVGFEVRSVQLLGETRSYNHFLLTVHKLG